MSKQGRAPKHISSMEDLQLVGTDDVMALYSDVFVVAHEGDTGLGSIYFYQRQLSDRSAVLGRTEPGLTMKKAKCIGRILMSQPGIEKLLEALAENRGFIVTRKVVEKE